MENLFTTLLSILNFPLLKGGVFRVWHMFVWLFVVIISSLLFSFEFKEDDESLKLNIVHFILIFLILLSVSGIIPLLVLR